MTMQEYWKKVKSESLDSMRRLIGQDVEDNCEDMERAMEYAIKHLSAKQTAKAISDYGDYKWAVHEMKGHELAHTVTTPTPATKVM